MWLYVPPTHLSTREVEDSTLDSNWVFEALSQSCAWRETQQPPRSWSRTWRRVDWLRALCGLIPEPLTASRGVASWIGSLEASRASRGQSQEHSKEPKTTDGSGHTSDASLAKWNPEDSSWRTSQASFWEESSPYSESWPKTGTTRSGQLFALQTLEPHIAASASSFWPTATQDSVSQRSKRYAQGGMPLSAEVVNWPTPSAQEAGTVEGHTKDGEPMRPGQRAYGPTGQLLQRNLNREAVNWPTATANRATRSNHHKGFRNLEETSEMWDTPDTMPEAPNNESHRTRADHLKPPGLGNQAEWMTKDWPSPTAHDGRRPGAELTSTQHSNLKREAIEWPTPRTSDVNGIGVRGEGGDDLRTTADQWQSPDTGGGGRTTKGSQRQAEGGLGNQSEMWATPTSRDHKDGANPSEEVATNSLLGRQAPRTPMPGPTSSSDGQSSHRRWASPQSRDYRSVTGNESQQREHATQNLNVQVDESGRKRLNPLFVAWLMGMETDWLDLTSFGSSATE